MFNGLISDICFRLSALFRRTETESELRAELNAHLEYATEKYIKQGMSPDQAKRRAALEFGGLEQITEECREARGVSHLEAIIQDIRYGVRMLIKNPVFTVVAVMTLALGIGANTAIFSVVNALLLRPLPYANPVQLVSIGEGEAQNQPSESVPGAHYLEWVAHSQTLDQIAAFAPNETTLSGADGAEKLKVLLVSANFLPMLGVNPEIGRNFLSADDQPDVDGVAMISNGLWQRRFGSDKKTIGQTITLDNHTFTVIGVLPPDFHFADNFADSYDIWVPLA